MTIDPQSTFLYHNYNHQLLPLDADNRAKSDSCLVTISSAPGSPPATGFIGAYNSGENHGSNLISNINNNDASQLMGAQLSHLGSRILRISLAMDEMDRTYGASFASWVRSERNCRVVGANLRRIFKSNALVRCSLGKYILNGKKSESHPDLKNRQFLMQQTLNNEIERLALGLSWIFAGWRLGSIVACLFTMFSGDLIDLEIGVIARLLEGWQALHSAELLALLYFLPNLTCKKNQDNTQTKSPQPKETKGCSPPAPSSSRMDSNDEILQIRDFRETKQTYHLTSCASRTRYQATYYNRDTSDQHGSPRKRKLLALEIIGRMEFRTGQLVLAHLQRLVGRSH